MTGSAGEFVSTAHDSDIVEEIARSRRRAKGSFRVTFTLTWVVLVGILLGSLLLAGKIDGAFIAKWAPYILGGVPITIFVSVTSIALAIILATLGALGRLSRNAVVYGVASFYVSSSAARRSSSSCCSSTSRCPRSGMASRRSRSSPSGSPRSRSTTAPT